jgi:hypothetical protein
MDPDHDETISPGFHFDIPPKTCLWRYFGIMDIALDKMIPCMEEFMCDSGRSESIRWPW